MKITFVIFIFLGFVLLLLSSCSKDKQNNSEDNIVCNPPYMRQSQDCCLDQNSNKICDEDDEKLSFESTNTGLGGRKVAINKSDEIIVIQDSDTIQTNSENTITLKEPKIEITFDQEEFQEVIESYPKEAIVYNDKRGTYWLTCNDENQNEVCDDDEDLFLESDCNNIDTELEVVCTNWLSYTGGNILLLERRGISFIFNNNEYYLYAQIVKNIKGNFGGPALLSKSKYTFNSHGDIEGPFDSIKEIFLEKGKSFAIDLDQVEPKSEDIIVKVYNILELPYYSEYDKGYYQVVELSIEIIG